MLPPDSDESENEGFVPNCPHILTPDAQPQPVDLNETATFITKYIVGQGVLRKEHPLSLRAYGSLPSRLPHGPPCSKPAQQTGSLPTARELYYGGEWEAVYGRLKEGLGAGKRATFQNEINLECCQSYRAENFRKLREWQIQQDGIQGQTGKDTHGLQFDSRFECGNLLSAFRSKVDPDCYTLFLQDDTNTYGYNQWFNFAITGAIPHKTYTFLIANHRKSYSFLAKGMQPTIFSQKRAELTGDGWYRDGQHLGLYKSPFAETGCAHYYTLQFSLTFQYPNDYVTVSACPPYSYSRLMLAVEDLKRTASSPVEVQCVAIARSLASNEVPYLTISKGKAGNKPNIVIIARQHASEIWSSFLAQQLMQQLVKGESDQARWVLDHFDVRIFPMVNIDGVIYGNSRCDLAGCDLNRSWKRPIPSLHPQVYRIKRELSKLSVTGISLYLDLHTHSRDMGAFAFCCVDTQPCRALPLLLSQTIPIFRYSACTFGITSEKEHTARAAVYGLTNNVNTITIEMSIYGFKQGESKPRAFQPDHIAALGRSIWNAFYCQTDNKAVKPQPLPKVENEADDEDCMEWEEEEGVVEGSDSQPEADQIELELRVQKVFPSSFLEDIIMASDKKMQRKLMKLNKRNRRESSRIVAEDKKFINKLVPSVPPTPVPNEKPSHALSLTTRNSPPAQTPVASQRSHVPATRAIHRITASNRQPLYNKRPLIIAQKSVKVQSDNRAIKPVNLVEFSLKRLPAFANQRVPSAVTEEGADVSGLISIRRDWRGFDKTYSTYEAMCRPKVRNPSRRIGFTREQPQQQLEQQLPYLCVMSENKKQVHMEKLRQKSERQQSRDNDRFTPTANLTLQKPQKALVFNKFRDKQKNVDFLSKMGLEQFRYEVTRFQ